MKTVFFGTPQFAVPTLAAMVAEGFSPLWVTSQPARPVGRRSKLQDPPVAVWAKERGIEVLQPEKIRSREFRARFEAASSDVAVVVAFGQIFRRRILGIPRLGCINLHGSLLPKYRGAAPIQAAIAAGESVTGVTSMSMDVGLDSGPMLLAETLEIGEHETSPQLAERLSEVGAGLMIRTLRRLGAGDLEPTPQDHAAATWAPRLSKEDAVVDWSLEALDLYNRHRAFVPWPGTTSALRDKAVKLLALRPWTGEMPEPSRQLDQDLPGTLLVCHDDRLLVRCGSGTILAIETVQVAGRKPVSAADLVNGERLEMGERFVSRQEILGR